MQTDSDTSPTVSVVVVSYNSGYYLDRCLNSLFASDISLDICVVDNHSSDGAIERVSSNAGDDSARHKLEFIVNKRNKGFSKAVNIGAAASNAEFLFVLNPDCQIHPHTISSLKTHLGKLADAGMAGPLVFNEDGTEQQGCRRNEPTFRRSAVKALGLTRWFEGVDLCGQRIPSKPEKVGAVSGCAMMFRRECFDLVKGMDEDFFLHCEDLDICRRIRNAGYGVYFVPGVSLFHRQGVSGGASDNKIESLKHKGMMHYYINHYGGQNPLTELLVRGLVWSHYLLKQGVKALKSFVLPLLRRNQKVTDEQDRVTVLPDSGSDDTVFVTGANSDVGDYLLQELSETGRTCVMPFRRVAGGSGSASMHWMSIDYFRKAPRADLPKIESWIHLAPIWSCKRFRRIMNEESTSRVIALSSTSVSMKQKSKDKSERKIVSLLQKGEKQLEDIANSLQANYTILRPTLIYGGPRNRNINMIQKIILRCRFFPLPGSGKGKRQPVHAQDVAQACMQVLEKPELPQKTYTIAGGETISYREMVERVFEANGVKTRFVRIPGVIPMALIKLLSVLPAMRDLSPELVRRLQQNQDFSIEDATRDFGFTPRKFDP